MQLQHLKAFITLLYKSTKKSVVFFVLFLSFQSFLSFSFLFLFFFFFLNCFFFIFQLFSSFFSFSLSFSCGNFSSFSFLLVKLFMKMEFKLMQLQRLKAFIIPCMKQLKNLSDFSLCYKILFLLFFFSLFSYFSSSFRLLFKENFCFFSFSFGFFLFFLFSITVLSFPLF